MITSPKGSRIHETIQIYRLNHLNLPLLLLSDLPCLQLRLQSRVVVPGWENCLIAIVLEPNLWCPWRNWEAQHILCYQLCWRHQIRGLSRKWLVERRKINGCQPWNVTWTCSPTKGLWTWSHCHQIKRPLAVAGITGQSLWQTILWKDRRKSLWQRGSFSFEQLKERLKHTLLQQEKKPICMGMLHMASEAW